MGVVERLRRAESGRERRTRKLAARERRVRRAYEWRRDQRTAVLREQLEEARDARDWRAARTRELEKAGRAERAEASRELLEQSNATVRRLRKKTMDSAALERKSRKATMAAHRATQRSRAKLAEWRRAIRRREATPGDLVLRSAGEMLGKVETGDNDAPWLIAMEARLVNAGLAIGWMIPGQPYCGMGVGWAYLDALGVALPAGIVYTPNIARYSGMTFEGRGGARYKLVRVAPERAEPGAIVVFDWSPGSGADHTGLARGPMRGGSMKTLEFNTSPTNAGSQSNGGGVWNRTRYRANVMCVLNVERV